MFEVLAFVYENFWGGDACPELPALQRQLNAVGFDSFEVVDALLWLEDLKSATRSLPPMHRMPPDLPVADPFDADAFWQASAQATRILTPEEQDRLGLEGWRLLVFLASCDALPAVRFELVMDRIMATTVDPISLADLKLIVLMVYWSFGEEPDALLLDELCDNRTARLPH